MTVYNPGTGSGGGGGATTITEGTSFPGSPAAGDLFIFIADDTNGVDWLFRRNAANTQWRFIGGPPMYAAVETSETTTTSASYADLSSGTVGPSITLPTPAGTYEIDFGARRASTTAINTTAFVGVSVDAAQPSAATGTDLQGSQLGTVGAVFPLARKKVIAVATPATAVKLLYKVTSGQTGTLEGRWLAIKPVKI